VALAFLLLLKKSDGDVIDLAKGHWLGWSSGRMAGGDYGAVERMGQADGAAKLAPQTRPAMPKLIAPVLVLIVAGCACVLVSALYKADNQMSQVMLWQT
jgi:hypothetical protein